MAGRKMVDESDGRYEEYTEAMEECAAFLAKMIRKYGDAALEEIKNREEKKTE